MTVSAAGPGLEFHIDDLIPLSIGRGAEKLCCQLEYTGLRKLVYCLEKNHKKLATLRSVSVLDGVRTGLVCLSA